VDVAAARVLDLLGPADLLGRNEPRLLVDQPLDLRLVGIAELVAVRPEQFDSVVRELVVAGGDHHAEVRAHRSRQHRHGRRRHRPHHHHVHADAGEAGDERRLHHVTGQARILADHHAMPVVAAQESARPRLPHALRHGRGHRHFVGAAANAVRTEEFAAHSRS
jgi:hypothetical protein